MTNTELTALYRGYIGCLNRQDWANLGDFVHSAAVYNGDKIGLDGYRAMLEADFLAIPDLHFTIDILVADPPYVSSRLLFDCTPTGMLFGLPVNGRRIQFSENVIYRIGKGRIDQVWSVIDKAAVAEQLGTSG